MFGFASKRLVLWPVTIHEPSDDGSGTVIEKKIKVRYVLLDRPEMAAALRDESASEADLATILMEDSIALNDEWLTKRIVGWADIVDPADNKTQIEYSPERLAALIRIPYVHKALLMGLWEVSRGAPAKN